MTFLPGFPLFSVAYRATSRSDTSQSRPTFVARSLPLSAWWRNVEAASPSWAAASVSVSIGLPDEPRLMRGMGVGRTGESFGSDAPLPDARVAGRAAPLEAVRLEAAIHRCDEVGRSLVHLSLLRAVHAPNLRARGHVVKGLIHNPRRLR